ncbi:hypothetical protein JKG47_03495 [Acidithiobacillus sp. MC6.1]|nr:hypothetical protein [Acidithiobacillus sp. MC6.1]
MEAEQEKNLIEKTVLVVMDGGCILGVYSGIPGLRVVIADYDIDGVEEPIIVPDRKMGVFENSIARKSGGRPFDGILMSVFRKGGRL